MARILLKTTIPTSPDDWSIARFSLLRDLLAETHEVDARDRAEDSAGNDPDLTDLAGSAYDQLWLFAVDVTGALSEADVAGIEAFRRRGGGLLLTRDHNDMGSCLCRLPGIGAAHHFHSINPEPDAERHARDDPFTLDVDWPNYHSGANGDYQEIKALEPIHPILRRTEGGDIRYFPTHPHEGAVSAPEALGDAARVVACGKSKTTDRRFNLAVTIDEPGRGRAVADATFHRFADYNWDPDSGCPSFVSEPPSDGLKSNPEAMADTRTYAANIARWLNRDC